MLIHCSKAALLLVLIHCSKAAILLVLIHCSKAAILLVLFNCLLLLLLLFVQSSVFGPCFVMQYFVSLPVLQSSF